MTIQQAINAPRLSVTSAGGSVSCEPGMEPAFPQISLDFLSSLGHSLPMVGGCRPAPRTSARCRGGGRPAYRQAVWRRGPTARGHGDRAAACASRARRLVRRSRRRPRARPSSLSAWRCDSKRQGRRMAPLFVKGGDGSSGRQAEQRRQRVQTVTGRLERRAKLSRGGDRMGVVTVRRCCGRRSRAPCRWWRPRRRPRSCAPHGQCIRSTGAIPRPARAAAPRVARSV